MGDRKRLGVGRSGGQVGRGLEHAEEVWLLEDRAGCVLRGRPELVGIGGTAAVRYLDDLEADARRIGLHDLAHLRVRRLGDHDLRAAGRVLRDVAGVGSDGRAVVTRRVRDVHAGDLADRGLVLEDRLEHPLAQLRLIGRVRGQEFASLEHRVDDRRHVVVIEARPEERHVRPVVLVLRRELLEVGGELLLGQGRRNVQRPVEANAFGQIGEQLLERLDADRLEHRVAVGVCQGEVAQPCSARYRSYASASISDSASLGAESRTRAIHPSPYGSVLTVSGASTIARLTSTISPESGATTSETAFTDSTSAYGLPAVTVAPCSGGSKWTSSPSASCANQVIPKVASSPSIRAQ